MNARVEEADLERAVADRPALAEELIEPLAGHHALAVGVDVQAATVAGDAPSSVMRKRTGLPSRAGPSTRCRSRALNR